MVEGKRVVSWELRVSTTHLLILFRLTRPCGTKKVRNVLSDEPTDAGRDRDRRGWEGTRSERTKTEPSGRNEEDTTHPLIRLLYEVHDGRTPNPNFDGFTREGVRR